MQMNQFTLKAFWIQIQAAVCLFLACEFVCQSVPLFAWSEFFNDFRLTRLHNWVCSRWWIRCMFCHSMAGSLSGCWMKRQCQFKRLMKAVKPARCQVAWVGSCFRWFLVIWLCDDGISLCHYRADFHRSRFFKRLTTPNCGYSCQAIPCERHQSATLRSRA